MIAFLVQSKCLFGDLARLRVKFLNDFSCVCTCTREAVIVTVDGGPVADAWETGAREAEAKELNSAFAAILGAQANAYKAVAAAIRARFGRPA